MIRFFILCLIAISLAPLSGCLQFSASTDETEYFVLTAPDDLNTASETDSVTSSPGGTSVAETAKALAVRRVSVADFLRTRRMVLREDASSVRYLSWHLWGGNPEEELERATAEALRRTLPGWEVHREPFLMPRREYVATLSVRVNDFSGHANEQAVLALEWFLLGPDGIILRSGVGSYTSPWSAGDYASMAEAQGRNVGQFAEEMAEMVSVLATGLPESTDREE